MRAVLSMKTLIRSPVRTILSLILLGVVSFAFFSRTAEYAVTVREMNSAAGEYRGVGSAEVSPALAPQALDLSAPRLDTSDPYYVNADPRIARLYPDTMRD